MNGSYFIPFVAPNLGNLKNLGRWPLGFSGDGSAVWLSPFIVSLRFFLGHADIDSQRHCLVLLAFEAFQFFSKALQFLFWGVIGKS